MDETIKTPYKLAIYRDLNYGWTMIKRVNEYQEDMDDEIRVSGIIEVRFPDVSDAERAELLETLTVKQGKVKEKVKADIQELQHKALAKEYIAACIRNEFLCLPPPPKVNRDGSIDGEAI